MKKLAAIALLSFVEGCASRTPRPVDEKPSIRFREAAAETGMVFEHRNGAKGDFHLVEIMGSGVALFDFDNDGDLDVYFVQGNPAAGGNKLFRNDLKPGGRLRFTDVTDAAGVGLRNWGMGVATGDYDSDGDTDLLVTSFGSNTLYRNERNGTFKDATREAGIQADGWNASAAFFDYDRDGDLDLFIARYLDFHWSNAKTCRGAGGALDYCSPKAYRGILDRLFRNEGKGKFVDVTVASGILKPAPGLGVGILDANRDGWPDIYVANDGEANQLWINNKAGRFEDQALLAGVALSEDGVPEAGMGLAIADYDADGDEDILVTNLTGEGASLYRATAGGQFENIATATGVRSATFARTGFGTGWIDADNDGVLELFVTNGAVTRLEGQSGQMHPFRQPASLLVQSQKRLVEAKALDLMDVGRGAAFGDVDNDGGVDIIVNNNNGPARLLLNESEPANGWLRINLEASQPIGARVTLIGDSPASRKFSTSGSYLSASEPVAHFGMGGRSRVSGVRVDWPEGASEYWPVAGLRRVISVKKGTGGPVPF